MVTVDSVYSVDDISIYNTTESTSNQEDMLDNSSVDNAQKPNCVDKVWGMDGKDDKSLRMTSIFTCLLVLSLYRYG